MKIRKFLALISSLMAIAILCTATFSSPEIKAIDEPTAEMLVRYFGNGGTTLDGLESLESTDMVAIENAFVRDTYKFTAWNTLEDGTGTTYLPGESLPEGTTELLLYAMWESDWYTVYYNGNGGATADGLTVVDGGQQKSDTFVKFAENSFIRDGYNFVSWNTKADGSGQSCKVGQMFKMPARNITFYAVWEETSDVDNTDTDVASDTDIVSDTDEIETDTEVASDTESDDSDTETESDTTTDTTTDTATETDTETDTTTDTATDTEPAPVEKHKLTYVVSEDETVEGGSYAEGDTINVMEFTGNAPKGQSFSHWSLSESGETAKYFAGDKLVMGDKDITLYAIYKNNYYKAIYVSNFSDENEEIVDGPFEYYSVVTAKKNTFVRPGYTFVGWNTLADGTGTDIKVGDKFYMPSFDVRIYAKWVKNSEVDSNSSDNSSYSGSIKTGTDNTLIYISAALFAFSAALMLSCALSKRKREF